MKSNNKTKESIDNYIATNNPGDILNNPIVGEGIKWLIPLFGGIAIETIKSTFDVSVKEKQKLLMNSIMNDGGIVIDDIPSQVEFIHDFNKIYECVLKLRNNKKIIYFANILKSEYKKDNKFNRADDFIDLLNSISYETLSVLAKLYLYEVKYSIKPNAQLSDINMYWKDFINSCISFNESFTNNIINTHLSILQSKGLCKEFNGSYSDYGGEVYKITEYGYLFIGSINNYQFEKDFIDPKDEIYEILRTGGKPDIDKYGIVKYYHYLEILEKDGKLRLSEPIYVLNAPCAQYKVLSVY
jgi:hypothetical protein